MSDFLDKDLVLFAAFGVDRALLDFEKVMRVTPDEAKQFFVNGNGARAGILFQYFDVKGFRQSCRLRSDSPDIVDGRPQKYVAPYGDVRCLYHLLSCKALRNDMSVPVVLVESEKATLAIHSWAERNQRTVYPAGMGGCRGWQGRIGKVNGPNGERTDKKGPLLDFVKICCKDREVIVMLDSNVASNIDVQNARRKLTATLVSFGCRVKIATVPALAQVNGPDDLLSVCGDGALDGVLKLAQPALEFAVVDAQRVIAVLKEKRDTKQSYAEELSAALLAVSAVPDTLQRTLMENVLSAALGHDLSKKVVQNEVSKQRKQFDKKKEEVDHRNREAELRSMVLDLPQLLTDLERYFSARMHLPEGAPLVFALFVLLTHIFDAFDAITFIAVESAINGCGKSTLLYLIEELCARPWLITSPSPAALYRKVSKESPTLLIDEAKGLSAKSELAQALIGILSVCYKKGGKVPRCEGENFDVVDYEVFCPAVFAAVGGLNDASLLSRSIVVHLEKKPDSITLKKSHTKARKRDAKPLLEQLAAFKVQAQDILEKLFDDSPDDGYWGKMLDSREEEIWSPLLLIARLAGPESEQRAIAVCKKFLSEKENIMADDIRISKAIAMIKALKLIPKETFTPGDLVASLTEADAWASTFEGCKSGEDGRKARSAKVGYFLTSFRPKRSGRAYLTAEMLAQLIAHVPASVIEEEPQEEPQKAPQPAVAPVNFTEPKVQDGWDWSDTEDGILYDDQRTPE